MSPVQSAGAAAYRAAVQLYPADFRREFGDEMARDFVQATREASRDGSRGGVPRLWARVGADFVCSLVLQWMRTGLPAVGLIAAACSFGGISMAARVLVGRTWISPPASAVDAELVTLFLLVIVLLLIILTTICVTLWIARPFTHRTRS